MPSRRARVVAGTSGTLALALLLAGCVIDPGSGRSPAEAREAFVAVLDSTQSLLGDGWQVDDDPTPRGCTIPLWVPGERYPGLRLGPMPRDSAAALETVADHWVDLGFTIEENLIGDVIELKAGETEFDSLIFRISESGMTLQGESECRPVT